ncbi:unnamed protein product [Pleuronectes platessa]|uniref:Uncharacterized protein n=1 Tax=Pleuronectes platessa TaxID=8262 RepID=A0A9N7VJE4_PLEPL|nr:unnamed protein product [Pleuronectes platessa]
MNLRPHVPAADEAVNKPRGEGRAEARGGENDNEDVTIERRKQRRKVEEKNKDGRDVRKTQGGPQNRQEHRALLAEVYRRLQP